MVLACTANIEPDCTITASHFVATMRSNAPESSAGVRTSNSDSARLSEVAASRVASSA
jgi:hypothetical protein